MKVTFRAIKTLISLIFFTGIMGSCDGQEKGFDFFNQSGNNPSSLIESENNFLLALQNVYAENLSTMQFDDKYVHLLKKNCPKQLQEIVDQLQRGDANDLPLRILLTGPSGIGKTSLARFIAHKAKSKSYMIMGASFATEYKNSGSQNLLKLFNPLLASNMEVALVIDELVALTNRKNSDDKKHEDIDMVSVFWQLLDRCASRKNIMIVATANDINEVPEQIRTRFIGYTYAITHPNYQLRKEILQHYAPAFESFSVWQQYWLLYRMGNVSIREIEDIIKQTLRSRKNKSRECTYNDFTKNLYSCYYLNLFNNIIE